MSPLPPDVLKRLRAGDARVVRTLVREHTPHLFDWMRGFGVPRADRDDLVQEVWMRVLRRPDGYSGSGSFRGWLYRVARNVTLDRRRADSARSTREGRSILAQPGRSAEPESGVGATEVERLLSVLTERQRAVVVRRVLEGWSTRDTARELACAPGTVKATLSQSLAKLRAVIESESSSPTGEEEVP
jgi:RNA polymerase sigma-70 factor (ECF subfamily)